MTKRERLFKEYNDLLARGVSVEQAHSALVSKYNVSRTYIRGALSKARNRKQSAEIVYLDTHNLQVSSESNLNDIDKWNAALASLSKRKRWVTVAHIADVHFPHHDKQALALAYELIRRKQPDIIIVGSDTADFSVISSFGADPDEYEQITDVIDDFCEYYHPHVDELRAIAPNAIILFLMGNHEERIYAEMRENAPKLRRTIERAWVDAVRYGGRVLWIGNTQEVEIGYLLVKHGDRHNEGVAKSLLEQECYQVSVMAGHVHRLTTYTKTGRKYSVTAITSGCLCKPIPDYTAKKGKRPTNTWQQGMAFATVDMQGVDVFFENIAIKHIGNRLVAISDNSVVEMPLAA